MEEKLELQKSVRVRERKVVKIVLAFSVDKQYSADEDGKKYGSVKFAEFIYKFSLDFFFGENSN